MEFEFGSLVSASIVFIGAFTTSIMYAAGAHSSADRANERCTEISNRSNERFTELIRAILDLRQKHDDLDNKIVDRLSSIEKALARIQGKLDINTDSEES